MGRIVDRHFIISRLNQYHFDQENNLYICLKMHCTYCKRVEELEYQLYVKKFSGKNSHVDLWLVSYIGPHKYMVLKPVFKNYFC